MIREVERQHTDTNVIWIRMAMFLVLAIALSISQADRSRRHSMLVVRPLASFQDGLLRSQILRIRI